MGRVENLGQVRHEPVTQDANQSVDDGAIGWSEDCSEEVCTEVNALLDC